MKIDTNSIAYATWGCKYHIVFAPKYRCQMIYGKIKVDIGQILRKLCEWKGVEIIEAEATKYERIHRPVLGRRQQEKERGCFSSSLKKIAVGG